jgi:hypothetical protein
MNRPTKTLLTIGLILLVYGYLCRAIGLNFFWDSKTIGGFLLFIALLLYWIDLKKKRKQQSKKTGWVTFGICVLGLGLAIFPAIVIVFNSSEAYHAAKEYLKSDLRIKEEVGNVESFGLIPSGSMQTINSNGVETGNAIFEMTVNGSKKNRDVVIELKKELQTAWTVTAFE